MGEWTTLKAADGHELSAWKSASPEPLAGLVVVQEIFGVNAHIRAVADRYAGMGFAAVAPALFDRTEKNVELGYEDADIARGRELRGKFSWDLSVLDIQAAADSVRHAGKAGVVGYCWGGSMAWAAACRGGVDAAACYYGAQIIDYIDEKPKCPAILVFGDEDASIPEETIAAIRAAHPDVVIETYRGPHGFACDHRAAFKADSARAAFARTFDFFARNLR
ncbi:MAG: dienelactone hydrolase family protein [Alphaproteobacteria bacterium]|nr:dienelactone hydrolase family protein [Alphaproteobacteria bacterium]